MHPRGTPEREPLAIRKAVVDDLEAIVGLYAGDILGGHGDGWSSETLDAYRAGWARVAATPGHEVYVATSGDRVVGTFMLSLLPGLSDRGGLIAQLRAVQVDARERSRGVGAAMVHAAEDAARAAGAIRLELTSNLSRHHAHRFYEREGYARTHAGFKKVL